MQLTDVCGAEGVLREIVIVVGEFHRLVLEVVVPQDEVKGRQVSVAAPAADTAVFLGVPSWASPLMPRPCSGKQATSSWCLWSW